MQANPCHPAMSSAADLLGACEVRRLRRSGPGGQNRNKVETAVVLKHLPTGVDAEANERRSQSENQANALFRLRVNLAISVRVAWSEGRVPSPLWAKRVQGGRLAINPNHDDFPSLLADVLDLAASNHHELKPVAQRLGLTLTQLVKFLKIEPRALHQINQHRLSTGQHAYV